jgi:hypothetical protein
MKELHKIGRAFGYVYDYGEYPAGYVFDDGEAISNGVLTSSPDSPPYYTLTLEGEITLTPTNGVDNQLALRRGVSWHELEFQNGKYQVEVTMPTRHLCISAKVNKSAKLPLPRCSKIILAPGQSHVFPSGSKVLFVDGSASINNTEIPALTSVRFKNESTMQAAAESFVLHFLD